MSAMRKVGDPLRRIAVLTGAVLCWLTLPATSESGKQIRELQEMLIWTGDYDGLIDGDLGQETRNAIKSFQQRLNHNPTGELTEKEKSLLKQNGAAAKQAVGFKQVNDNDTGLSVGIPQKLVSGPTSTKWGNNWKAKDGSISIDTLRFASKSLPELYNRLTHFPGRHIDYARLKQDWFVVSGTDKDGSEIYVRSLELPSEIIDAKELPSEIVAFSVVVDKSSQTAFRPIPIAMSSSFAALSSAGSEPRVQKPAEVLPEPCLNGLGRGCSISAFTVEPLKPFCPGCVKAVEPLKPLCPGCVKAP